MHTILICDDDRDIVSALDIYLTSEGYRTLRAYNGLEAIQAVERNEVHLILMDIMMPELDGIRATARLREGSNIPIILLTAKSEDADKILGLNIGADDYITKPFNPLELVARVKAQLRRYTRYNEVDRGSGDVLDINGLVINRATHECWLYDQPLVLTPIEFDILWMLCSNRGQVISAERLFETVWGEKYLDRNNTVMVHIRRLREKMGEPSRDPRFIKTVWGVGYKVD